MSARAWSLERKMSPLPIFSVTCPGVTPNKHMASVALGSELTLSHPPQLPPLPSTLSSIHYYVPGRGVPVGTWFTESREEPQEVQHLQDPQPGCRPQAELGGRQLGPWKAHRPRVAWTGKTGPEAQHRGGSPPARKVLSAPAETAPGPP